MEEQENLETIEIGTIEEQKLEPKKVKIVKTSVESVGDKGAKKVVCETKHPDKEETIQISAAKIERQKGKLEISGLWFNLDRENKIKKNSALAVFLKNIGVRSVKELEGKEIPTLEDENGYLVFKGY